MTPPILAATIILAIPTMALADPCHAIPDRGPMPADLRPGSTFSGPVVYVGDGDGLCVDVGSSRWVEVRVSDFYAPEIHEPGGPEAKAALERIVMGRKIKCIAGRRSFDRVVATCTLKGRTIGDLMRSAGVGEGGRGRR